MNTAAYDAFGVVSDEVLSVVRGKVPAKSGAWDDFLAPVHAKVFTLAGAQNLDMIKDFDAAIQKAITQGLTLADFRKDFKQIATQYGWQFFGLGKTDEEKLSWRSKVVFETNMRAARMAGKWQQMWENREAQPYLEYRVIDDKRLRPAHRAWKSVILPIEHPWWDTHYPPNGWGCRCKVRARGQEEMDGKEVGQAPPMQWQNVSTKDGVYLGRTPKGVDFGFDHNVGKSWLAPEQAIGKKLVTLPPKFAETLQHKAFPPELRQAQAINLANRYATAKNASNSQFSDAAAGFLPSEPLTSISSAMPHATPSNFVAINDAVLRTTTEDVARQLPFSLWQSQAVLLDTQTNQIVVIAPSDKGLSALTLQMAKDTQTPNRIVSIQPTTLSTYQIQRYKIVSGTLTAAAKPNR